MSLARSGRWINFRVIGRERAAFHWEARPELPKPPTYPRQKCRAKASPGSDVACGLERPTHGDRAGLGNSGTLAIIGASMTWPAGISAAVPIAAGRAVQALESATVGRSERTADRVVEWLPRPWPRSPRPWLLRP
jgi:hypothetical protein